MRLDLHVHSTASDGRVSPGDVVRRAVSGGLDVIALADHDTTAGIEEARATAEVLARTGGRSVEVVSAIEVSTTGHGEELHFLGYFVDPSHPSITSHAVRAKSVRSERMKEMIRRLDAQGVPVTFEEVLSAAGPDRQALARPHLARALVDGGHAASTVEAFDRFIGNAQEAFVPTGLLSPTRGIELIVGAGGIPVWAHPPHWMLDELIDPFLEAGLRGLEIYRPKNSASLIMKLESAARSRGLLVTGGSDWHGPDSGNLGDFWVTSEEVSGLLEAGGI
jgi:predicted metal-dependent phosphoesterase TrpH